MHEERMCNRKCDVKERTPSVLRREVAVGVHLTWEVWFWTLLQVCLGAAPRPGRRRRDGTVSGGCTGGGQERGGWCLAAAG